jgi:Ca2+-binding RTX toxin-like protein
LGGSLAPILGQVEVHSDAIATFGQVKLLVDGSLDTTARQATFIQDANGIGVYGLSGAPTYGISWYDLGAGSSATLRGGLGDDTFKLQPFLSGTPLTIDGGGGGNTLDYSAYSTPVTVNLLTGQATDLPGGVSHVQNVTGGSGDDFLVGDGADNVLVGNAGNDVLIGGDGNDVLLGGSGRDLLIGGLGADHLDGGTGDDILIGGYTDFDTQISSTGVVSHNVNRTAIDAIMREWTRTDLDSLGALNSYKTRVDHLMSGVGGLNGTTVLQASGKNAVVHDDDGASDVLTGGDGYDWFFASKKNDTVTDSLSQEKVS